MKLYQLGLRVAAARIRRGELTSEAYARALLARSAELESRLHAFAWLDPGQVIERARAADAQRAAGRPLADLHGIPAGVKDIIATRAIPTRMGSPVFADHVPAESAAVVKRLEAAGGFVFGKTVTSELAYFHPGPTRNPWNPAHTPGGSSMGSAAAVAAGMVPMAIGTQTNGSVIRPAAFCGCVGYKPSAGLIARTGIQPFSPTLDQVGVFARSVEDAALAAAALVGHDPQDPHSLATGVSADAVREFRPLSRPPRLAAVRSPVWAQADAAAQRAFDQSLAQLAAAGAVIEDVELPAGFEAAHATHRTIMVAEGARSLQALQAAQRAQLSTPLNQLIDAGRVIGEAPLAEARAHRLRLIDDARTLWSRFDAIVTPPVRGEAPATLEHTGDPVFCTIWSLLGLPAITVPVGPGPGGLPLGLQIVGGALADAMLLSTAQWCARVLGDSVRFPTEPEDTAGSQPDNERSEQWA